MSDIATPFGGLLRFDDLTYNDGLAAAFTVGYRLEDAPDDPWTARFTSFKFDGDVVSVRGATNLMTVAALMLVKGLGLDRARTAFIPAMRSSETRAETDGALASIARRCAATTGCRYLPEVLSKAAHLPTGRGRLDPEFRVLLVEHAHYHAETMDADVAIVVDDIIATGKTMSLAASAIREKNPDTSVYGFGLAKTGWRNLMRLWHDADGSNDHIPPDWEDIWNAQ